MHYTLFTQGTGRAGQFNIDNPTSTAYALAGETNGGNLSAGVYGRNTGNGFGVYARAENGTLFGSAALYAEQLGTGDAAGAFRVNNGSNSSAAVYGETNGSGFAIWGYQLGTGRAGSFQIDNATNTAPSVRASTNGLGRAGWFQISNLANGAPALVGETNGTGPAILANQSNGGFAIELTGGGIKLSALSVVAPATITSKAALYEVTGTGNINLPATGPVGETCWVANASGTGITVEGAIPVANGTVRQFIRLTGGWQIVN